MVKHLTPVDTWIKMNIHQLKFPSVTYSVTQLSALPPIYFINTTEHCSEKGNSETFNWGRLLPCCVYVNADQRLHEPGLFTPSKKRSAWPRWDSDLPGSPSMSRSSWSYTHAHNPRLLLLNFAPCHTRVLHTHAHARTHGHNISSIKKKVYTNVILLIGNQITGHTSDLWPLL